jgi:cytochrome c-type biogenesis protein CcmF
MKLVNSQRDLDTFNFLSKLVGIAVFMTISIALLLLYIYFATSNMNIKYVWEYSSRSLSWEYKMSAVLAGMSGSLLFWVWCITFAWFVEELIDFRKPKNPVLMAITRIVLMTITAIFIGFLIVRDIFGGTPQSFLDALPDGNGLNPLLQTPLMIVHPPVVFLAYGFCVVPFAASVGYLITNDKKWVNISLSWSRWAWLFLTLGIGVGGLWAYVVLGWGGYWAWDPVETSSFLPWLLLTAFLHAQLMFKRKKEYKFGAPALGIYTFVLILFATFTTRAGGIWLSVHAFGSADVNVSPWERFMDITTSDGILYSYFLLMLIIFIGGTILIVLSLLWRGGLEEDLVGSQESSPLSELINDKSLMFVTIMVIVISTIVTLLLLILAINGADRLQFDSKVGLFLMVGIAVLAVCLFWKLVGRIVAFGILMGVSTIASVLITLLWRGVITSEQLATYVAWLSFGFALLALVACVYKIIVSINKRSLRGSLNNISPHIVHLGIVLLIIGFVGSNFMVTEKEITLDVNGPAQKVGTYDFKLVDIDSSDESLFAVIQIGQGGNFIGEVEPGLILIDGQVRNEIGVFSTPVEDVYLTYIEAPSQTSVTVNVKVLPWMSLVWSGMWLMAVGIVIRLVVDYTRPSAVAVKGESRGQMRARMRGERASMTTYEDMEYEDDPAEPPEDYEDKTDEYYEDLIEEELRKLD